MKNGTNSYVEELLVDSLGGFMSRTVYVGDEMKCHLRLVAFGTEFTHEIPDGRKMKVSLLQNGEIAMRQD